MKKMICAALLSAMMLSSVNASAALIGGGSLKNSTPAPASPSMGIGSSVQVEKEEKKVGMSIGSKPQSEPTKSTGMGLGGGKKDTSSQSSMGLNSGAAQQAEPAPATAQPQVTAAPQATAEPNNQLDELKEIWLNPNPYYYLQLSDAHKAAWEKDIENVLTYPQQTKAATQDRRYQALASMIKTDNPRLFWIDWIDSNACLRFETGSNATYAPLEIPDGKTLAQMQETFLAGIDKAVGEIQKNLSAKSDTRAKAKSIHDWLCRNNSYNYDQTSSHKKEHDPVSFAFLAAHSAYSAIVTDDAYQPVCEGYAMAFKLLCDELGVPCLSISGSTNFASGHMWNLVQLEDGKWYLVDATSDDVEKNGVDYVHQLFLVTQSKAAQYQYTPAEYLNSGINPSNGYTEGAAFTVPELTK